VLPDCKVNGSVYHPYIDLEGADFMKIDPAFVALQRVSSTPQMREKSGVTSSGRDSTALEKVDDLFTRQEAQPALIQSRRLPSTEQETEPKQVQETAPEPTQQISETSKPPSSIKTNENGTLSIIEESPSSQSQSPSGEINFARMYGVETSPAPNCPESFSEKDVESFYYSTNGPDGVGDLSPEGMKLYEAVKAKYLDRVPVCPVGPPTLYLTGGLPGSGKGYILSRILKDRPEFVLVDPDEIKKDILRDLAERSPQMKEQIADHATWNDVIHETSSDMAKRLMNDALVSGKDIVFDSSMASRNINKYRNYAKHARVLGYQVNGIISDVSEETAVERAYKRAGNPIKINLGNDETLTLRGRFTKPAYIHDCAQNLQSNLDTYLKEGMYDRCVIFDNNSTTPTPSAVYEREQLPDGTFSMKRCSS